MTRDDLAGRSHWDGIYSASQGQLEKWRPTCYTDLCIEHFLVREIERIRPRSILEIGCGNSTWLPYLANRFGMQVAGMDYSEEGCQLARNNLRAASAEGVIYCGDLFQLDPATTGTFDLVYSLGVVEHFSDLDHALKCMAQFVTPGGTLLTEVPNLHSLHGIMAWLYQPDLLAKHRILQKNELLESYGRIGLQNPVSWHAGLFSPGIVAWGLEPRYPALDRMMLPLIKICSKIADRILRGIGTFKGTAALAPFICITGSRPAKDGEARND